MFVSTEMRDVPVVTDRRRGAIGVDLNADWQVPVALGGEQFLHQAVGGAKRTEWPASTSLWPRLMLREIT